MSKVLNEGGGIGGGEEDVGRMELAGLVALLCGRAGVFGRYQCRDGKGAVLLLELEGKRDGEGVVDWMGMEIVGAFCGYTCRSRSRTVVRMDALPHARIVSVTHLSYRTKEN